MLKKFLSVIAIGCAFGGAFLACDNGSAAPPPAEPIPSSDSQSQVVPVDYTLGRIMNTRLGRGINLGNSWDSRGSSDKGWGNPIRDTDFAVIKAAGFNSVRIPVQWHQDADKTTHTVNPNRLAGVIEDIQLAMANGLAVVVNFHHYSDLNCAGGGGEGCKYDATKFQEEKAHFVAMWANLAATLNAAFPADDMLVLEILNEPIIPNATLVDQLMNEAYTVIRAAAPGKTIMFEAYHAAKFGDLGKLHLPPDGNIIFSGHYYEPYKYTHQGAHGYECVGDKAKINTAKNDMKKYVNDAQTLYPDINGVDHVPMNMGEFGVAGGTPFGCNGTPPTDAGKAEWVKLTTEAAVANGISFHYWGFGKTGGFDAYQVDAEQWYPGFPEALIF